MGPLPKKEKEEKIPHMCESIGHRPLRGRCPKGKGIGKGIGSMKKERRGNNKGGKKEKKKRQVRRNEKEKK